MISKSQTLLEVVCDSFNTFSNRYTRYYVDDIGDMTFEDILKNEKFIFKDGKPLQKQKFDLHKPHWFLIEMKLKTPCDQPLIFELFDFRYQSGEVYLPNSKDQYKRYDFGNLKKFDSKNYKHKNFVFDLNIRDTKVHKIYIKLKSNENSKVVGSIRNSRTFVSWALNEYFYLAIFYGIVISLFLYNLFIYIYLKDSTYIYYTTYIAFAGLWAMSNDGLGFQYIWYNYPIINTVIFPISNFLMITMLALYARKFFESPKRLPIFDKILVILLIFRAIPYSIWILNLFNLNSYIDKYFLLDTVVVLFLLCIGIEKINIRKHARIYVLAFTCLLLSYLIFTASYYYWIKYSLFTLYSINFGIAANMIILAVGLVSRLRSSMQEADFANKQVLYNLKEKELLKDEHNRQLELKVIQRTHELIAKNEELNSFVYRASHDIKGPISSLIGLAKIGQIEQNPEILREYFKHVLSSSEKLDKTLNDLLQLSHVSETDVKIEESNLSNMLSDVLSIIKLDDRLNKIKIDTEVTDQNVFVDERMLKPILHNLIENSLKYSDIEKLNPFVKISIYIIDSHIYINVLDNGIGIPEDYQDRVFDKFFRVGVKGSGSGLGLHIVKKCIEKLNGKIELVSTVRLGTSVTVILPM